MVRAIKIMAAHCIETAVMDEAAAIDGSRPLEQIADARGYAWGSTDVQMTHDLTRFKVLLMSIGHQRNIYKKFHEHCNFWDLMCA